MDTSPTPQNDVNLRGDNLTRQIHAPPEPDPRGDNPIISNPPQGNTHDPPTHGTLGEHETPHPPHNKKGMRKKANIKIATLNMNGLHTNAESRNNFEKWSEINTAMKKQNIAILALQETHMDEPRTLEIQGAFKKRLQIHNTESEHSPRASGGVAFAINKDLINILDLTIHPLIPGRVLYMRIKWNEKEETRIINAYAPNKRADHQPFWEMLEAKRTRLNLPKPDFLVGDFNVTEDPIDRSPAKPDNPRATDALRNLRQSLGVIDQWRHENPKTREYTYRATRTTSQIKSRLDRIYVAKDKTKHTFEWNMRPSPVPTDHWLVSVRFAPADATHIGKGRWAWPLAALNDKKLISGIEKLGKTLERDITNLNPTERNHDTPQTLWANFKKELTKHAKQATRTAHHRRNTAITNLNKDRERLLQDDTFNASPRLQWEEALLANKIAHLERLNSLNQRAKLRAKIMIGGEKLGSAWANLNKQKKPKANINRLQTQTPNDQRFVTNSKKMANLAKQYHEHLQTKELHTHQSEMERKEAENEVLSHIPPNQKLQNPGETTLSTGITQNIVEEALRKAKNGSAAGLDGIPYELWKSLKAKLASTSKNRKGFDILRTLTLVFQDIQQNGVDPRTSFAKGLMIPIYKKKDKSKIENYRPITLLNTDYKLLTKSLAIQLTPHITPLIHKDQAGFIPRRSIFDHIRLTKIILKYSETMNVNGAIIALDQEKAYDKIAHPYLWRTLDAFDLPPAFSNTVRSLYENASTSVSINGMLSKPYKVTRGVRQGDPLSCFLFNLAIEPMACMIRNNPDINGIEIPGTDTPLKVNLFADDTVVYLGENDKLDDLLKTLDKWCKVSGAKFNKEKTEILPIGNKTHRNKIVTERRLTPQDSAIDISVQITKDGEAIRSLGAWIGYNTKEEKPWEPVLDKIRTELDKWTTTHPNRQGKRTIAQTVIGARTQFLTKAQGMPDRILNALTKEIDRLVWNDKQPRLAKEVLQDSPAKGGIQILDLKARNEAIDIMWLKGYLNFSNTRPTWALITDALIKMSAPKTIPKEITVSPFLQSWTAPSKGKRAEYLDKDTLKLIKTAKKFNVTFAPIRLSQTLKGKLPAWNHPGTTQRTPLNPAAHCLIRNHNSLEVDDLIRISSRLDNKHDITHIPVFFCQCDDCKLDREQNCDDPHRCATEARKRLLRIGPKYQPLNQNHNDGLSLTKRRKRKNEEARNQNGCITFNPSTTTDNNLADGFRIFVDPGKVTNNPAQRQMRAPGVSLDDQLTIVYTDGSCANNGKADAVCGAGVWFAENDDQNLAIRIPGDDHSNQIGELAAIVKTLEVTPNCYPLLIKSDSKYAIDGLTKHLESWEDQGWIGISNRDWFKKAAYLLRSRSAPTSFQWVKGHSGEPGNEGSDELAKAGLEKDEPDEIPLQIPEHFDVQGANLAKITQTLAYKGIKNLKPSRSRRTTTQNLEEIKEGIKQYTGQAERDDAIWTSTQNPSITPKIGQFLFNAIHGTQKIGKYWTHLNNMEERAKCLTCDVEESMTHILAECQHPTRQTIWNLAKEIWPYGDQSWPMVNLGTTLGCGLLSLSPETQTTNAPDTPRGPRGASRLLQILWSEATHLIWVLRCERVIQESQHTPTEIESRWKRLINKRLTDDKIAATKVLRTKNAISKTRDTWENALKIRNPNLHPDWITRDEVF
jgi:ribonuclease HI/exonuclease III